MNVCAGLLAGWLAGWLLGNVDGDVEVKDFLIGVDRFHVDLWEARQILKYKMGAVTVLRQQHIVQSQHSFKILQSQHSLKIFLIPIPLLNKRTVSAFWPLIFLATVLPYLK